MCKLLLFAIWALGALMGAIIFISSARKAGSLNLDDLLICVVTCAFSFFGIAFLWLFQQCETIADKFGNPVIWKHEDEKE